MRARKFSQALLFLTVVQVFTTMEIVSAVKRFHLGIREIGIRRDEAALAAFNKSRQAARAVGRAAHQAG